MMGTFAREVSARVVLSAKLVMVAETIEIQKGTTGKAGSFFVRLVAKSTLEVAEIVGLIEANCLIEIQCTCSATTTATTGWSSLMTGIIDRYDYDPLSGTIEGSGRDLTQRLLNLLPEVSYLNKTSSEVAALFAAECGLTAVVDQTTSMVGQYYQIQHSRIMLNAHTQRVNAWDVLAELALLEGFDLSVEGQSLFFGKPASGNNFVYTLNSASWSGVDAPAVSSIGLSSMPALPTSPSVVVRSWNSRQKRVVEARYPSDGTISDYTFIRPNLLDADAARYAQGIYQNIAPHRRTLTMHMPGELSMKPGDTVQIQGTNINFDGEYATLEVERRLSVASGFEQNVIASLIS